jgi:hypothetical protein
MSQVKTNENQIKIDDIKSNGMELLSDSESFFNLLNEDEMENILGGLMAAAGCCCTCCCSCHAA